MPTLHEEGVSPTPPLPLTSAWAVREGKDKVFGAVGGGGWWRPSIQWGSEFGPGREQGLLRQEWLS